MKSLNALVQAVQWPQSYDFFPKAANFWQRKFRLAHFCLRLYMGTLAPFSVIFWRKNVQLSEYFCIFARETIQIFIGYPRTLNALNCIREVEAAK